MAANNIFNPSEHRWYFTAVDPQSAKPLGIFGTFGRCKANDEGASSVKVDRKKNDLAQRINLWSSQTIYQTEIGMQQDSNSREAVKSGDRNGW